MRLRIHFCLQFYCAHSPMPAFSNVLIVNSLPFRTQDIRAGAMLCGTTKPGFCYSSCDTTEICKTYADIHFTFLSPRPLAVYRVTFAARLSLP